MSRPDEVPARAEEFSVTDFMKPVDLPSQLAPGAMQRKWNTVCPRCSRERALPDSFRTINCAGCGLYMHHRGTTLYVWAAEAVEAAA